MKTFAVALILILSCAACENSEPAPIVQSIEFGGGGGFTGASVTYSLDGNGQLIGTRHDPPHLQVGVVFMTKSIDPNLAKRYMSQASKLLAYNYSHPDNMSSWLIIHSPAGDCGAVWGFQPDEVDPRVIKLYDDLGALLK